MRIYIESVSRRLRQVTQQRSMQWAINFDLHGRIFSCICTACISQFRHMVVLLWHGAYAKQLKLRSQH